METYGYDEQRLRNTGSANWGLWFSVIAIIINAVLLVVYFLFYKLEDAYIINIVFTSATGILRICVMLAFVSYLGNFRMPAIRMLMIIGVVLSVILLLLGLTSISVYRLLLNLGDGDRAYLVVNLIQTIFTFLHWVVCIAFGIMMMTTKNDFVGGIRSLGCVVVVITALFVLIYLFRRLFLHQIMDSMAMDIEQIKLTKIFISAITTSLNIIILLTYTYVFNKAIRYKIANL
jgi:hypothetical protein